MLEMSELGQMRTQLLAQLKDSRHDDAKKTLLLVGIGNPSKFKGVVNGEEGEVFLYDDALVFMPRSKEPLQLLYSFVEGLETDATGYHLTLKVRGTEPISLERFANRTGELSDSLKAKIGAARVRTSAFFSTLLPGLGPIQVRQISALLADGIACEASALDSVETDIFSTLFDLATIEPLKPLANKLASYGETWLGFKQRRSVEQKARGGEQWHDHTHGDIQDHGGLPPAPMGIGGMMMASTIANGPMWGSGYGFDGAFGERGSSLAYEMLGISMMGRSQGSQGLNSIFPGTNQTSHEIVQRAIPALNPLTLAKTNYEKLRLDGKRPAILSFLIVASGTKIIYRPLNDALDPTIVFTGSRSDVGAINRGLALIDFDVDAISDDSNRATSRFQTAIERISILRQLRATYQIAVLPSEPDARVEEAIKTP